MKFIKNLILLVVCLALSGCVPQQAATTETPQPIHTPDVPTAQPTNTWTPPASPEPTGTPSTSPSPTPPANIPKETFVDIDTDLDAYDLNGCIVLQGNDQKAPTHIVYPVQFPSFILDLDDGTKWELGIQPEESFRGMSISPDLRRLAFHVFSYETYREKIVITDANGQIDIEIPITDKNIGGPIGWYDSEHLLLNWIEYDQYLLMPGDLLIFDPETGVVQETLSIRDFPEPYSSLPDWEWLELNYTVAAYNFADDLVVYRQREFWITLLDMMTNEVIAVLDKESACSGAPRWSADGEYFAIDFSLTPHACRDEELYVVDHQGNMNQMTFLSEQYDYVQISSYSWSPDGQKIAFWVNLENVESDHLLALLDIETKAVELFTNIRFHPLGRGPVHRPVWSPDGSQIMVNSMLDDENFQAILMDLDKGFRMQIAENMLPIGWMVDDTP